MTTRSVLVEFKTHLFQAALGIVGHTSQVLHERLTVVHSEGFV